MIKILSLLSAVVSINWLFYFLLIQPLKIQYSIIKESTFKIKNLPAKIRHKAISTSEQSMLRNSATLNKILQNKTINLVHFSFSAESILNLSFCCDFENSLLFLKKLAKFSGEIRCSHLEFSKHSTEMLKVLLTCQL